MDFFGFLKKSAGDFAGGVGGVFKTAGDVGFNFLKGATTPAPINIAQAEGDKKRKELLSNPRFKKELDKNPELRAQFDQTAQPIQTPADVIASTLQAAPRAIKSAGLTLRGQDQYAPAPGLEQAIYGQAPIKNLTGSGRDIVSTGGAIVSGGKNTKAGENIDPALATGLGFLGATLDVFPGNPLKAGGKQLAEQLAKDTTESAVKKTLAGKLPPEVINKVAPSIAMTKDKNVIQNILDREAVRTPPLQVITRAPTESPELSQLVKAGKLNDKTEVVPINSLKLGSDTAGSFDKGQIKSYVNDIRSQKTIDPLVVSEKNGQDFVQDGKHRLIAMKQAGVQEAPIVRQIPKEPRPLYRASLEPYDPAKVSEDGVSVSSSRQMAGYYSSPSRKVEELSLSPSARVMKASEVPDRFYNKDVPKDAGDGNDIAKYARQKGYDAVELRGPDKEIRVVNPSVLSPKSPRPLSGAALQATSAKNIDNTTIDQLGGMRPENALQTQFETALNSGDIKGAQAAIDQLPTQDLKAPLQSILDRTKPQSITEATIPKTTPEPLDEITNALNGQPAGKGQTPTKGIATISAENRKALSKERGQRFAASEAAGKAAEGSQGYFAELKQLKGEYTKTKLGGMIENVGPQRAEELFNAARQKIQAVPDHVYDELGYFPKSARLNTQTAIRKVIFGENGGVPTASELKLIRVINPKLADNIESRIPKARKLFDIAAKLAGIPRALQSSFDLSMGGRQGLLVAARHPVVWARANKESIKYLKSDTYFKKEMSSIRKTPEYALGDKYGLATPAADLGREESFAAADYAEKIPGIKASERAYNGGLTKLRSDLWVKTLKAYGGVDQVEQKLGAKGMQDLAEAINTLTGRGGKKGGFVSKHVNTLSETLFAPRLWAARLNTLRPEYYARLSPAARKVALENAGAFAAVAGVVLGAASALGGQVETDPRSSDFLKIRFGDTRYDIFGGLQQNLVFAWRELTGEKKSTQTGEVTKFAKNLADIVTGKTNEQAGVDDGFGKANRLTIAADLVTNKLAPLPAGIITQLEGKDRGGNEINPLAEIAKMFVPINATGVYETSQATGSVASGAALNIPSFFGIGTQTYGVPSISLSDKQKAVVQKLQDNGAPAQQVEAVTRFYQTQKTVPDRNKASGEINKALADGDQAKAIQIAKDYNSKYASAFKDWVDKYSAYSTDEDLVKEYTSGKIKLTNSSIQQRLKNIKKNPQYAGE